jgi:hypothetical protein
MQMRSERHRQSEPGQTPLRVLARGADGPRNVDRLMETRRRSMVLPASPTAALPGSRTTKASDDLTTSRRTSAQLCSALAAAAR